MFKKTIKELKYKTFKKSTKKLHYFDIMVKGVASIKGL